MQPNDLTNSERLALMGLLKLTVSADNVLSNGESAELLLIADEMGNADFIAARREAEKRLQSREDIRQAVATVQRPTAQRLIYELILKVAAHDGIIPTEAEVLRWVAELWGIEIDAQSLQPLPRPVH